MNKTFLKFSVIASLLALAACQPSGRDATADFAVKPKGFEDCIFANMSDGMTSVTAIRCPNSSVSTTVHGKHPVTSVTIDGEQVLPDTVVLDGIKYSRAE